MTAGRVDTPGFLSGPQLREMVARGHVIGSHSYSHPKRMGGCPPETIAEEWRRSVDVLQNVLGAPILTASVPGGFYTAAGRRPRRGGRHPRALHLRADHARACRRRLPRARPLHAAALVGAGLRRRARRRRVAPAGRPVGALFDARPPAPRRRRSLHDDPADVLGATGMTSRFDGPDRPRLYWRRCCDDAPGGCATRAAVPARRAGDLRGARGAVRRLDRRRRRHHLRLRPQPGVGPGHRRPARRAAGRGLQQSDLDVRGGRGLRAAPVRPAVDAEDPGGRVRRRGVRRHVARPRAARGGALDQRRRARLAGGLQRLRDLDDLRARERAAGLAGGALGVAGDPGRRAAR